LIGGRRLAQDYIEEEEGENPQEAKNTYERKKTSFKGTDWERILYFRRTGEKRDLSR